MLLEAITDGFEALRRLLGQLAPKRASRVAEGQASQAAAIAPTITSATALRSDWNRYSTRIVQVGGPKAGIRLTPSTIPNTARYWSTQQLYPLGTHGSVGRRMLRWNSASEDQGGIVVR